jgi:organic hydroperoxide reductase OsmC/OhrA
MNDGLQILYTAEATAVGGREGHARTSDGRLDVALDVPRELGGSGGPGTNPEQLFATGYATCFQSALLRIAAGRKLDLSDSRITARVDLRRAHQECPYSRATRGNIEVRLSVGGVPAGERRAAA